MASCLRRWTRVQGGAIEIGTTLARVEIRLTRPNQWHVEYFELAALPGPAGTVVVDDYAYLFGNAGQAVGRACRSPTLIKPDAVLRRCSIPGQRRAVEGGARYRGREKARLSANVARRFAT